MRSLLAWFFCGVEADDRAWSVGAAEEVTTARQLRRLRANLVSATPTSRHRRSPRLHLNDEEPVLSVLSGGSPERHQGVLLGRLSLRPRPPGGGPIRGVWQQRAGIRAEQSGGRLAGHTMIVMGAAGGIGSSVAAGAALDGARLLLVDRAERVIALADECRRTSPHRLPSRAWVGDAADPDLAARVVSAALDDGRLDSVVVAAGTPDVGHLADITPSAVEISLDDNLFPHLGLCRKLLGAGSRKAWLGPHGTSVVFIISKHAVSPGSGFGAYPLVKAAQLQLMRLLAQEGAGLGIRANAVSPGAVFERSGFWTPELLELKAADHALARDELEDYYRDRNLLRHRVVPEDVAEAALYLAGPGSRATTGAVIPVDGGLAGTFSR